MIDVKPNAIRAKRVTWLAVLAAIPLALLLLSIVVLVSRQRAAAAEYVRLAGPKGSGNVRLAKWLAESTSKEGSAAWSEISTLCAYSAWGEVNDLPILGSAELPTDWSPQLPWAREKQVADYLSEMRPVIELIHASADVPKPVWQPMVFDGLSTLLPELQESRGIARLLQLDALFAIHVGDADRAVAAMRSMRATAEVYDWHLFLVGELVNLALLEMLDDTVGKALQAHIWSPEQLETLNSLVGQPIPIAEKWRGAFETEALMLTTAIDEELPVAMFVSDSEKLQWFKHYQKLKSLADASVGELSTRADEWDREALQKADHTLGETTLNDLLTPAAGQVAAALERAEYRRRLTYTAVAIKRFKTKNGAWPNSLDELTDVGLTDNDWSVAPFGVFGYEVTEEKAVVFTYADHQDIKIALPPMIRRISGADYDEIVIR